MVHTQHRSSCPATRQHAAAQQLCLDAAHSRPEQLRNSDYWEHQESALTSADMTCLSWACKAGQPRKNVRSKA